MKAVIVAAALMSAAAYAQDGDTHSPRSSMLELKFGTFTPNLDGEAALGSATPIASALGGSVSLLLAELQYEHQFFQKFGSAALGGSVGYAELYGKATTSSGDATAVPTGLITVPLKAHLTYRFDYFAVKNGFPLVPYGKASLIFLHWWMTKGGVTESAGGQSAVGWKRGFGFTGGLSFLLDVLEPRLATEFDSDIGVNNCYLFAEFEYSRVNSFGRAGFDFSDNRFMFGLAFEF